MGAFAGKVAWITGGGSGIGKALALEIARQGAKVAVSGRREARLEEVVAAIEADGGEALAVVADVTTEATLASAVEAIVERFGRLDVTVACAGFGVAGRAEKMGLEVWRRQFEVNVFGAVATVRAALPELRKTNGRLALIGSVAALLAYPSGAAYSASKAVIASFGNTLYVELRGSGVSCTTLHPGFVESEINQVDNLGVFHPDRVDRRPKALMWKADRAARVMLRAIHRRRRRKVITGHGVVIDWLSRFAPGLAYWAMSRFGRRPSGS